MSRKKIALVTGASSGLGEAFVRCIDRGEAAVEEIWLIARRRERLENLAAECRKKCRVFAIDLCREAERGELVAALEREDAEIDLAVSNAGLGKVGRFDEIPLASQQEIIDINLAALLSFAAIVLPRMQKGSRLIHVASVAAFLPQPGLAVYAASKAFVLSFSRALHSECKAQGVTVLACCPNPMDTEFFSVAGASREDLGLKRLGVEKPETVAKRALRRAAAGKDISLSCFSSELLRLISRIFPHVLILSLMRSLGFGKPQK